MCNKFLIVVDMQNDFIDGTLGTKEANAIVPFVVDKIKKWDGPIIATYDTHNPNYLATREGRFLPVEHCIKNSDGWKLNPEVYAALQDKSCFHSVYKPTFGSTLLPDLISDVLHDEDECDNSGEFSIELIGLCTDICVVSNALLLHAYFPEVDISVDAQCCAGVTPDTHNAALTTMNSCQIVIKNL